MSGLSDWEKGMLLSSMTPGSCAMIMGRSQAWVERMRARLAAPVEAVVAAPSPKPPPPPAPPPAASPQPAARSPQPAARSPGVRPCRVRVKPSPGVTRLKPMTARVRRWAGWFLAAGWPTDDVAMLFDVDPDHLVAP